MTTQFCVDSGKVITQPKLMSYQVQHPKDYCYVVSSQPINDLKLMMLCHEFGILGWSSFFKLISTSTMKL